MKHIPLFIFLGVMAIAGGMLVRGAEYSRLSYEKDLSSRLQANLLSITKSAEEKEKDLRPVHLLFTGDVMLGRTVGKIMDIRGDYTYPFSSVSSVLRSADVTFANLEGPVTYNDDDQGSIYSFAFNPRVIKGIKEAGIDVVSLANNHVFDRGMEGMRETIYFLENSGVEVVGIGEDEIEANEASQFTVRGVKIAYLAYTPFYGDDKVAFRDKGGLSRLDGNYIKQVVSGLRDDGVDIVVVSMHWGDEYQKIANNYQKGLAKVLAGAGVDLVVGHHPHVTQEIEKIDDMWVAYSLGNFIFDQNFSEDVRSGLVLSVMADKDGIQSVEGVPIYINQDYQPEFVR